MENIVGQVATGKNFYPRIKIINLIYRRLKSGSNIYLSAPRRMGKTSIMKHLEKSPRPGYKFQYIISESIDDANRFFKQILSAIQKSKTVTSKTANLIGDFLKSIEDIEIAHLIKVSLNKKEPPEQNNFFDRLKKILNNLEIEDKKLVIMIDEFPQAVENIIRRKSSLDGEQFLQYNRELRHIVGEKILFIYTGSIGISSIAEKLDATKEINDLNYVEIYPLSFFEGKDLVQKILFYEKINIPESILDYLVKKIDYLVPFHIQLICQNLIDLYHEFETEINESLIDKAFSETLSLRNENFFEHYYSRLKKVFSQEEYMFVLDLLKSLTKSTLTTEEILLKLDKYKIEGNLRIIKSLEFDGYISKSNGKYIFSSPILKSWWENFVI